MPSPASNLVRLGWREWVGLPALGIVAIRAKVDTGARSSALHVDAQQTYHEAGVEWVRFRIETGIAAQVVESTAPVLDRRRVTDSGGHATERIFIRTPLALAGLGFEAEINLSNRRNMLFPMLLGRTALAGRFLVDPAASFLLGEPSDPTSPP